MISTPLFPSSIHLLIVAASWRTGTACITTACIVGGGGGCPALSFPFPLLIQLCSGGCVVAWMAACAQVRAGGAGSVSGCGIGSVVCVVCVVTLLTDGLDGAGGGVVCVVVLHVGGVGVVWLQVSFPLGRTGAGWLTNAAPCAAR